MSKLVSEINAKIFSAARDGDIRSIKVMIASKEFDINYQNPSDGRSILHVSAYYGHKDLCEFLLNAGANHALVDNLGFSALGLAVIRGHIDTLKLFARKSSLLAIGQPLGAKLCELVQSLNNSVLQNFLAAGASPDERNTSLDTPLHVACRIGNVEAVQVLLKFGSNASLTNRLDRTAVDEATENSHHDIVKRIEEAQRTRLASLSKQIGESFGKTMFEREEEIRAHSQIVIAKWWRGYCVRIAIRNRFRRLATRSSFEYERR
jgi:ankyrin repeat protein